MDSQLPQELQNLLQVFTPASPKPVVQVLVSFSEQISEAVPQRPAEAPAG